jgi:hypothetical protein
MYRSRVAATLTPDAELTYYSFPISKTEEAGDGSGDLIVWGKATDGTLDSDLQIVDPEWSAKALQEWYDTGGNVRVQHQAQRDPAGRGIDIVTSGDGTFVKSRVVEPVAVKLVKAGVLQDYSVGIMNPDIRRGDPRFKHLDPMGKAVNGVITGRDDGMSKIGELSLVDRGSNFGTRFQMVKAAADGSAEFTGTLTAPDEVLAKVAEPAVAKAAKNSTVTVDLPKNVSVSFSPKDLAKLVAHRQVAEQRELAKVAVPDAAKARIVGEHGPELVPMNGTDEVVTPAVKAMRSAEAAVYKRDIDTATRQRLASEGKALKDGTYPIETETDMHNAYGLARSKHGKWKAALKLISRRARQEGWTPPGRKDKVAAKAAEPGTAKCKCGDTGMMDGKPCPSCKKGRKKAKRAGKAEKAAVHKALAADAVKKKKSKVLCGGCGARQNSKHAMCSECGKPMSGAMPVEKNHDFTCLGCGSALDKGEKHCPSCGKENPGYNPMADHKIPANQGKVAGKESVTKRKKGKGGKGKKDGNPFGDKQAPPFGAKDGDGDEAGSKKSPKVKKAAKPKTVKRKGKGKGRSPAKGVAGHDGTTMGLPAHREPDGAPVEEFEKDTSLSGGDEHQEMAAAMRHKSLAARGLSREDALLHDLTCPAFSVADVRKCFPYASFADINDSAWQREALMKAASAAPEDAYAMRDLFRHAETLKNAPQDILHELREQGHEAFLAANKALLDATPGPGSFPTPGHITPQQFQRPYIDAGHAAESPQASGPNHFKVPEGQIGAGDFTRGFLAEGHAADSPQNDTPRHEPVPAPMTPGKPSRMYYTNAMRDNVRQAVTAMHDHISRIFPDVCPMSPEVTGTQKPAPDVPEGVGGPAPRMGKKARKVAAKKAARALARKRRRLERKVLAGKMSVNKARKALGLKPATGPALAKALKGAGWTQEQVDTLPSAPVSPAVDAGVIKAAVAEANAPLLERIAAQDKMLRKQRKAIDAIASQPDTSRAPLRGVALTKASAAPAAPQSATSVAEQVQMAELQRLHYVSRESPDPAMREAARRDLDKKLALSMITQT